jgi:four helix bundle protein
MLVLRDVWRRTEFTASGDEAARVIAPVGTYGRARADVSMTSVVANITEGAGEYSPREKARFYRMARRSAIEVVAWLEITQRRHEASEDQLQTALRQLEHIVEMLVALIKRCDR